MSIQPRALFVTPAFGAKTESGGVQVSRERLSKLAQHFDVTVLSLTPDGATHDHGGAVLQAGALQPRSTSNLLQSYFRGLPLSVWRNSPQEIRDIAEKIAEIGWDLIYVDHWLMWEVAQRIPADKRVLHLHNAEPELFFRAAKQQQTLKRLACWAEGWRATRYLRRTMRSVQELHLLSEADRATLSARGVVHPNTRVFLPKINATSSTNLGKVWSIKRRAIFVGSLGWLPNAEGLRWFMRSVLSLLNLESPVLIVGGGADAELIAQFASCPNALLLGYVDDLTQIYGTSRCLVAPLLSGSGIKMKIVNALAEGLPVVTTSVGVEGFPLGWGDAVLVADDARTFACHVSRMLYDDEAWWAACGQAKAYAQKHFNGSAWNRWCEVQSQSSSRR